MKTIYTLLALSFLCTGNLLAQSNIFSRTNIDPNLAPFYHGVASGDPLSDRVIIWTRYTPDATGDPVTINWEMATDTGFINVVQNGNMTTQSERDWTVKVDVTGLAANMWYYYRFEYNGDRSLVGRTRTAPTGAVDSLRFAVASCSDYSEGYFHGYRDMSERNDIDAVLHLGDYIYEYSNEPGQYGADKGRELGRISDPTHEIVTLSDYRRRYALYRSDEDLQLVHSKYPFICAWMTMNLPIMLMPRGL